MDIHQTRTETVQEEIIAKMNAHQERLGGSINAWRKDTTACQEATEACLESKEPTSLKVESIAVHEEVPKEEAAVETFGALKKRHGDWHLAIGCCRQLKKWTQGSGGSWNKLATTLKQMTRHAGMAQRKIRSHKGLTMEQRQRKNRTRHNVAQGTGKIRWEKVGYNNGMRNQGLKEQLCLGSERTAGWIFRKALELEILKRRVEPSWKMNVRTLWRCWPPPK
jgi:hypothetical protein